MPEEQADSTGTTTVARPSPLGSRRPHSINAAALHQCHAIVSTTALYDCCYGRGPQISRSNGSTATSQEKESANDLQALGDSVAVLCVALDRRFVVPSRHGCRQSLLRSEKSPDICSSSSIACLFPVFPCRVQLPLVEQSAEDNREGGRETS